MHDLTHLRVSLAELRTVRLDAFAKLRLPFYFGCELKILIVADGFLYFDDQDFGLSDLVSTLRGMSSWRYPVRVDLAHRGSPLPALLAGGRANFVFSDATLAGYHQVWIMASETSFDTPIDDNQRQAIRRYMDNGGGVFATGDHEDLGVTVGGYLPRVRSMRRWFWPNVGPQGEPVAPNGGDATRHDTNREGHDAGFSFNDQSDDVPQTILPHFFGGGIVKTAHPLLCTPQGPIRVLPDHAHEGVCEVPANLGAMYAIGSDSFREYPDGPDGRPLAPVIVATSTMIPGAEAPEFFKPPVPGGSFGAIGAWDGHQAGRYGRIVVDATWHHFININLTGDSTEGLADPAVPKSMGFLHTAAGQAHYGRIQAYFRNIADWLTPRAMRRCLLYRHLWWAAQDGWVLEHLRRDDLVYTGRIVLERLGFGPCDRLALVPDLEIRLRPEFWRFIDPLVVLKPFDRSPLDDLPPELQRSLAHDLPAAMAGAIVLQMRELKLTPDDLRQSIGENEAEVPAFVEAAQAGIKQALGDLGERVKRQAAAMRELASGWQ